MKISQDERGKNIFFKIIRKIIPSREFDFPLWTIPIVLLLVTVLSYGLYANQLGFYWDDWSFAWTRMFRGLDGLKLVFSINRPMRAYFEQIFSPLLGVNPFSWQICSMFMRWLAALALWGLLRQVWPLRNRPTFMVALFYIVYPGFSQQSLAMTYYYYWFFQAAFFFSLGIMVWAIRNPKFSRAAMLTALLFTALHLFSSEYLFGLELIRPILLWMVLGVTIPDLKKRFVRTGLLYTPFLFVTGIFLYWRVFVFKFQTYQPELLQNLQSSFLQSVIQLGKTAIQTLSTVSFQAWMKVLQLPDMTGGGAIFTAFYPWLVIGGMIMIVFFMTHLTSGPVISTSQETTHRGYAWQFICIGIFSILVSGIPYYITLLPVHLTFPEDRFTMSYIFGVSLLLVGLLEILPNFNQSIILASLLAALAIGINFHTAYLYRNERDLQKKFLWELTWRAPGFQPGTLILYEDKTFPYTDDEGLSFALNWTYAPDNFTDRLSYAIFNISARLGNSLPSLKSGLPVQKDFLSATFSGDTDRVLVIYNAPPSCLRVLDPIYDANIVSVPVSWDIAGQPHIEDILYLPQNILQSLPLANLGMIIPNPAKTVEPPAFMFSPQPTQNWCYLFEKADLARQVGDWEMIAHLGQDSDENFMYPNDLSEYLVFIEAYAHTGRWQNAQEFSMKVAHWAPVLKPSLCEIWLRAQNSQDLSNDDQAMVTEMMHDLSCPAY